MYLIKTSRNTWETQGHKFRVVEELNRYSIYAAQPDGSWERVAEAYTLKEARRLVGPPSRMYIRM